eukprot:TRINITY_DN1563_c0_g1_i4.p1 TRINITY_DN1563_c0_g1~~TRINITY_DN1563_c0_g1_i4.p1  ORF type:complete len:710 (-),score=254.12 TRINITY_DN1563_c0_g1_i4:24-2153(-)
MARERAQKENGKRKVIEEEEEVEEETPKITKKSKSNSGEAVIQKTSKSEKKTNDNSESNKNYPEEEYYEDGGEDAEEELPEGWEEGGYEEEEEADKSGEVKPEEELSSYRISPGVVTALNKAGVTKLFPIQYKTFNPIYDGKDIIARARTGTGKTFAFAIPLVEKLRAKKHSPLPGRKPQVIVLSPTRELAQQIAQTFVSIVPHGMKISCVYGGMGYGPQIGELQRGVDILVGTPGRVQDHLQSGNLNLSNIDFIVLDEADEMLNVGFADAIENILSHIPQERDRQTLLFSATIPDWVGQIAKRYLKADKLTVDLVGDQKVKVNENITNMAMYSDKDSLQREPVIPQLVKAYAPGGRTIVFVQTKAEAQDLATSPHLRDMAKPLHGDMEQRARNFTMTGFTKGEFTVLVATDVAARGLDISNVDLVIQTSPPKHIETFTHRVGRTARAGKKGSSIMFFQKLYEVKKIERVVGIKFKLINGPSVDDVIDTSVEQVIEQIKYAKKNLLAKVKVQAEKLIAEKGAEQAVAAALLVAAGVANIGNNRSLVTGRPGFTSLKAKKPCDPTEIQFRLAAHTRGREFVIKTRDRCHVIEVPTEAVEKILEKLPQMFELAPPEVPDTADFGDRDRGSGDRRGGGRGGYGGRFAGGKGKNFGGGWAERGYGGGNKSFGGGNKSYGNGGSYGGGNKSFGGNGGGRGGASRGGFAGKKVTF